LKQLVRRLALIGALALAATPLSPAFLQAQELPVIRVGAGPVDQATPIFYAAKSGLYKKYGLDVQVVKLANGAAIAAAVAGGSAELGQGSPLAVILAFSKGLPFTVIGNLSSYDAAHPDFALLAPVDSPIKNPKDLEGRTLGAVALEDMNSLATFAWMDAHGVDRTKLKVVELPASATLAAMEQSRVDASTFYEPFLSSFLSTGKVRVVAYPYEALGKRFSTSVMFGGTKWVADHRDAVDRFLRATQEASVYVSAHESESAQLIADFAGVDVATLPKIRHGARGAFIVPGDLQPMIDAAAKYKVIPRTFAAQQMICSCALRK
jgi:NitT/TauT family transport system substrate-binding protein